ncbi:MAG: diguanylate cyclase [Desulfarculus sp.]|nr:diguanylate cyclase [Desulfarculus sp.]
MTMQTPVIMVVDDSRLARTALVEVLEKAGYRAPITAASGAEALEKLEAAWTEEGGAAMDLIITDIVMDDISGIEVCRRVRRDRRFGDIPVIIVTQKDDMAILDQAFAAGANDYLTKPINAVELTARVRSALALKAETDRRLAREARLRSLASRLAMYNRKLRGLSNQDGLTGVANRRHLDRILKREWSRAQRHKRELAAIMVDIDHFKAYNDRLGHLAGDECLRQVAQALAEGVQRGVDLVARFGGEEFCILLPENNATTAMALAEHLRRRVEALGISHPDSPTARVVTVSLGVATAAPRAGGQPVELVESADLALYQAKQRGRNQCRLHGAGD